MLTVKDLTRLTIGPLSFSVDSGECVAITGPSGSGKSVLLRAIVDLDPNSGQVSTGEMVRETTPAPEWRKHVSLLPAESGWWGEIVGAHFQNPEKTAEKLPEIGLDEAAMTWEIARLSSGEKHRLALLRCLENTPQVLLLDEPTAALDHETTLLIEALLKRELDQGVSILIVTHDMAQAQRMAGRNLQLQGRVLCEVSL